MAETLVLANLTINADGTITAYNQSGRAVTDLERKTSDSFKRMEGSARTNFERIGLTQKRLIDGFVNMRRLISGLFVGFSVGGMVFALAELVQSLITSTTWFKNLKEAVVDFTRSLVLGEDEAERFARKANDALKDIGIRGPAAIRADMQKVLAAIQLEQERLASGTSDIIQVMTANGLKYTEASVVEIAKLFQKLKALQLELRNILGIKPGAKAVSRPEGPEIPDIAGPQSAIERSTDAAESAARAFELVSLGLNRSMLDLQNGKITWEQFNEKVNTGVTVLRDFGITMEQIGEIAAVKFQKKIEGLWQEVERLNEAYKRTAVIAGLVSDATQAAADAGIISSTKAAKIQHLLMATLAFQQGLIEVAKAAASAASYDAVGATLHSIAASLFFAAAAFQGIAAFKGSSGGGGGGRGFGGGSRAAEEAAGPSPSRTPSQYTIYIDGGVWMGTREEIARLMAAVAREGDRDNN